MSYTRATVIDYSGGNQTLAGGPCDAIYVGGAGILVVRMKTGAANVTFTGLLAGNVYPISAAQIIQATSTATNCLALYE